MSKRWSEKRVWDWYNGRPWLRGCNFMSSDCVNRVDQWQELGFEERLETTDRELAAMEAIGMNTVRLIIQYEVWEEQHDGFMERFERYLQVCDKHHISAMIVFGNDCCVPKDENYVPKHCGPQKVDWGYHGGVKNSPHAGRSEMGYNVLDEPETAKKFMEMVGEIMSKYAHDPRICIWDMYNEAGNSHRGEVTVPHLQKMFELGWDINPDQPMTSCLWTTIEPSKGNASERLSVELSDIISYHCYGDYVNSVMAIRNLKELGRPLVNTEWLHRIFHNNVQELFPLFYLEKVGCYNWGFVAGLYQTYEPWESIWRKVETGKASPSWDLTKWQHDLLRPNLRPYDIQEVEIIKKFSALAEEDFAKSQG